MNFSDQVLNLVLMIYFLYLNHLVRPLLLVPVTSRSNAPVFWPESALIQQWWLDQFSCADSTSSVQILLETISKKKLDVKWSDQEHQLQLQRSQFSYLDFFINKSLSWKMESSKLIWWLLTKTGQRLRNQKSTIPLWWLLAVILARKVLNIILINFEVAESRISNLLRNWTWKR